MAIKRTAECDICGTLQVEPVANSGWEGWAIIQGISMVDPVGMLTQENTQTMLCLECKENVKSFLEKSLEDNL